MKSGARVLDILNFFGKASRAARSIDIATELGLPKSSTYELLQTLVEAAWLTFDPVTKTYRVSVRTAKLGTSLARNCVGGDRLLDLMRELNNRTGEVVGLFVPNGLCMQWVASIPGAGFIRELHCEGARIGVLTSACGHVFLGTKPDVDVATLARHATRGVEETVRAAIVRQALKNACVARRQGFAVYLYPSLGLSAVAMLVPMASAHAPMIIGIGVHRLGDEATMAQLMRDALAGFSEPNDRSYAGPRRLHSGGFLNCGAQKFESLAIDG